MLWRENPVFFQEMGLCLVPHRSLQPLADSVERFTGLQCSHKFSSDSLPPPPKNSAGLCCTLDTTIQLATAASECSGCVLTEFGCVYKLNAFHGSEEFLPTSKT